MGIFTKKEDSKKQPAEMSRLPELPRLPNAKLPELPNSSPQPEIPSMTDLPEIPEDNDMREHATQLPTFPAGQTGDNFSQNSIKNAVTGRTEQLPPMTGPTDDYEVSHEPIQKEPEVERRIVPREPNPPQLTQAQPRTHSDEPIYIRIDKFEESLKVFDKVKEKIHDIESLLKETKEIKEKEKKELNTWQEEIQKIKTQIEKVDKDIFSKVE